MSILSIYYSACLKTLLERKKKEDKLFRSRNIYRDENLSRPRAFIQIGSETACRSCRLVRNFCETNLPPNRQYKLRLCKLFTSNT